MRGNISKAEAGSTFSVKNQKEDEGSAVKQPKSSFLRPTINQQDEESFKLLQ